MNLRRKTPLQKIIEQFRSEQIKLMKFSSSKYYVSFLIQTDIGVSLIEEYLSFCNYKHRKITTSTQTTIEYRKGEENLCYAIAIESTVEDDDRPPVSTLTLWHGVEDFSVDDPFFTQFLKDNKIDV